MEESQYSLLVLNMFDHYFPKKWTNELYQASKKSSFIKGIENIQSFRQLMISQYAQLVLSGDHLTHSIEAVDELLNNRVDKLLSDEIEGETEDKYAYNTQKLFRELLRDIYQVTRLLKYHVEITRRHFESSSKNYILEGIAYKGRQSNGEGPDLIEIFELICDVCADEYKFSYESQYIKKLIWYQVQLTEYTDSFLSSDVYKVVWATLTKTEFLLGKLALYSENQTISYHIDFKTQTIKLDERTEVEDKEDFRELCLCFYNPHRIPEKLAREWYESVQAKDVDMWKIVYLMRYYCKCTQSIAQMDKLIEIAEAQNKDYFQNDKRDMVNDSAALFFINYLYNSRFSFMCKFPKEYGFERIKKELEHIQYVQHETGIHSYHPYQKACQYLITYIEDKINDVECGEDLKNEWNYLNECYLKLKQNVEWCSLHQPYLMQFRHKFSTYTSEKTYNIPIYYPSAVSRPLKFEEIYEDLKETGNIVTGLKRQICHQAEKVELQNAKRKIDKMENDNLKHMGYFVTVTTFLVGLLAIFIGNAGGVSIFEKMEYVIALGMILLLFVCVGYLAITENAYRKIKYWLLLAFVFAGAIWLGWNIHIGYEKLKKERSQIIQQDAQKVERIVPERKDTLVVEINEKVETENKVMPVSTRTKLHGK